ncbi:Stf0 family sulfotransferase [Rhodanobacter sp. A1T4]|uniref:Stf0 family sulfotransferase n=1 Tax=Rhodanobacter sp. A1T4 TaxID=2723087 RepID=UPI001620A4FC|nr:Stf0 family sulfotransferase [Rhodanobacter sp. A1T4]MBB6249405.1 LPS sulfotransferase NodH [Rhodanobacter sp. A1T4]
MSSRPSLDLAERLAQRGIDMSSPLRSNSPISSYIICTNPRSGSWLLSEGLTASGLAGNPREWFNVLEEDARIPAEQLSTTPEAAYRIYLQHVRAAATTPNGVFGAKLHYYQFAELPEKLGRLEEYRGLSAFELISTVLRHPRHIWLTRRDKARQALSYFRACQSGEWWRIDGVARPAAALEDPPFDGPAIWKLERVLEANERSWQDYFQRHDIEPLVVVYEDLAADYAGQIARVLQWLRIPGADATAVGTPRLKQQSNPQTEAWLAQYQAFKLAFPDDSADADTAVTPVLSSPLYEQSREAEANRTQVRSTTSGKADRLQSALQQLAALAPATSTVERRSALSRNEFLERYYAANRPVIMRGLTDDWPAIRLWSREHFKRCAGDAQVEIMAGRATDPSYETNIHRHRREIRFADYVDQVFDGGASNDYYLTANNDFFRHPGTEALLGEAPPFTEYLDLAKRLGHTFLWFGPAGSMTPLHHDPCNVFMAQVFGRKRFKIVPAKQWSFVYHYATYFSEVDCEHPDFYHWPLFRHANVQEVVLEPGEVLFMPVGWWHQVRSLETSAMVSFTNFVFPNTFDW